MSSVLIKVLRRRGAQIFTQSTYWEVPMVLGGGHRPVPGTNKASSILRAHSFRPGASPHCLPSPLPAPFREMFYELCAWIFWCLQQEGCFPEMESQNKTSGTWILSLRNTAAQTVSWEETVGGTASHWGRAALRRPSLSLLSSCFLLNLSSP